MYNANHHSLISYRLQQGGESKKTPRRTVKAPRWMASNDFIGFSPQGSSIRREPYDREKRKARRRNVRRNRDGETESVQKNERKRDVCTRACALWSPVGLPFNRWLDSPTHSFIHTRCTRFESISKPRKRIFPIGLATASLSAFLHGILRVPFFPVNLSVQHIASNEVATLFSRENNFSYIFVNSRAFSKSYYYVVLKLKKKLVSFDVVRNWLFNNFNI